MKRWFVAFSSLALFGFAAMAEEPSAASSPPVSAESTASVPAVAPPVEAVAPNGPVVFLVTSLGTITLTLDEAHAPTTVKNFIRYAQEGHFNGTAIYRVVPHFVVQMGSIDAKGKGRPLHKPVPLESGNGLKNVRGTVALARAETPASGAAEFFINLGDNSPLDPQPTAAPNTTGYAVFGLVTGGMDVVDAIAAVPLNGGYGPFRDAAPKTPILLRKVVVARKTP